MAEESNVQDTSQPEQPTKEIKTEETKEEKPREIIDMEVKNRSGVLLDQLEVEMRQGYRDVTIDDIKIRIYLPDVDIDQKLSDLKIDLVGTLLSNEVIITREQIMNSLRKRSLWDDDKEKQEQNLTRDIVDLTREIIYEQHSEEIDYEHLKSLRERKSDLDKKRTNLVETRDYFVSASLEAKVDIELFKHQLQLCIKKLDEEDNESLMWETIEDLKHTRQKHVVNRVSTIAGYFWNGWSEDLLQEALDV